MAFLKIYLLLAAVVLAAVFEVSEAQISLIPTRRSGSTTRRPDNRRTEPSNEGQSTQASSSQATSRTSRTRGPFVPTIPTMVPNNPTTASTGSPTETTENPNQCCPAEANRTRYCCTGSEECFAERDGNKTCRATPTTTTTTTPTTTTTTTTTTPTTPTTTTTTTPTTTTSSTTADPEPRCCEAEAATGRSKYCCFRNETCVDNRVTGQRDCKPKSTRTTTTTTTTTTEAPRPGPRCCPAETVGDDERSEYCCADRPAREYCTERKEDGRRICQTY